MAFWEVADRYLVAITLSEISAMILDTYGSNSLADPRMAALAFALAMSVALAAILPASFWGALLDFWVWLWT